MATAEPTISDPTATAAEAWDSKDHPWRRFGARVIDNTLFAFIFSFVLAFVLAIGVWPAGARWLNHGTGFLHVLLIGVSGVVACAVGTALCLARWGRTPGKWLFGIKVLGEDGALLSQSQANRRELSLLWWGVGFGITYLTWIMSALSFFRLRARHRTRWDATVGATVQGRSMDGKTTALVVTGFVLVILIQAAQIYMLTTNMMNRVGGAGEASVGAR